MKKYGNTYLYAKGSQANSEGYKCFDISTNAGKIKFVKEFGIGTVIEPKPKKFQKIPQNNKELDSLIWDIVKFYNEKGYLMFFSDNKDIKQSLINQIAETRITLTKAELEQKAKINEVWEEIAAESIQATKEKTMTKEGWKDVEFTDEYLYQIEFTEEGIRYYEGTEERYLDIPVGEEGWDEPQWTAAEIKMLIEGLK